MSFVHSTGWAGLALMVAVWLLSGCAAPKYQPLFVESKFHQAPATSLRVMPLVDARKDNSLRVDLERDIRQPLISMLSSAGYPAKPVDWVRPGPTPPLPDPPSAEASVAAVLPLVPAGGEPFAVVRLEQVIDNGKGLDRGALVVMAMWIIEPGSGKVLWMDRAVGNSAQGFADPILITLNFAARNPTTEAVALALDHLRSTLPARSGK